MAITPLEYVEANKFPRDVRDTLNDLVERDGRIWEVRPAEANSIQGARFEISDDRVVLILPRSVVTGTNFYPFYIFFKNVGSATAPQFQRGVYKESPVQPTVDPETLVYADGLLSDDIPKPGTSGWVNTADKDFIWQEISFDYTNTDDPFTILDDTIKSVTGGAGGNHWPVEYINTGSSDEPVYAQTKLRIPIALIEIDTNSKNKPVVKVQYADTVMRLIAVGTVTAKDSDGSNPVDISGMMYTK